MTGLAYKSSSVKPRLVIIRNLISSGGAEMCARKIPSHQLEVAALSESFSSCEVETILSGDWRVSHTHTASWQAVQAKIVSGRSSGFFRVISFKQQKWILIDLVAKEVGSSQNNYEGWDNQVQKCLAKSNAQDHAAETVQWEECYDDTAQCSGLSSLSPLSPLPRELNLDTTALLWERTNCSHCFFGLLVLYSRPYRCFWFARAGYAPESRLQGSRVKGRMVRYFTTSISF